MAAHPNGGPRMTLESDYEELTKDVSAARIARVYAEALLAAAEPQGQAETVHEELFSLIHDVFPVAPDFESFLHNLAIGRDTKEPAIRSALEGKASETFLNFLLVLNQHERLELLRPISAVYRELLDRRAHRVRVLVKSAVPLSDDQRDQVVHRLRESMKNEPVLDLKVDPDLIGGLVVQVGDWRYDGSVRNRLLNLRNKLIESSSHEIQTGRDRFRSDA
jgi:F-type H+-transporting ATPase subunit delta